MDKVRIVLPPSGGGLGTRVETPDGTEVPGIASIDIRIRPDSLVTATMELAVTAQEVEAHPLLGLETLARSARALEVAELSGLVGALRASNLPTIPRPGLRIGGAEPSASASYGGEGAEARLAASLRDVRGRDETAAETRALREEIAGMREEMRQLGMRQAASLRELAALERRREVIGTPKVREDAA